MLLKRTFSQYSIILYAHVCIYMCIYMCIYICMYVYVYTYTIYAKNKYMYE